MTISLFEPLRLKTALLASTLGVLLIGCGGGASSPAPQPPPPTPKSFVYALRDVTGGANQLYGYQLDPDTGQLAALPGFPIATGGVGKGYSISEGLAYDAANRRIYALNSSTITIYSVDARTGALAPLTSSPINLGPGGWSTQALHPSGSPLIVGGYDSVQSYVVTATSAIPATGSPYPLGAASAFSSTVSRNGAYVYLGGNTGAEMAGFSINATSGVLTPLAGSPYSLSGAPVGYASDSEGRLFLANLYGGTVNALTTSTGVPSVVSSGTSGLVAPVHGVLHPAGFYLLADRGANRVGVYRVGGTASGTTLGQVAGSPFVSGGDETHVLGLDATARLLVAANATTRNLTVFSLDVTTGFLTQKTTQPADAMGATGRLTGLCVVPKQ